MKLIILAAGKGSRFSKNKISQKYLIKIKKKTLIEKIIDNFKYFNLNDISVIVGYRKKKLIKQINQFKFNKIKFIDNKHYDKKDMLYSFYLAIKNQDKDLIISYSDIYYSKEIIKKIIISKNKFNIIVPVTTEWKKIWKLRGKNIFDDCETLKYDKKFNLLEIGNIPNRQKQIMAQYMGIIFIPISFKTLMLKELKKIKNNKMHITNFLNIICKKYKNVKVLKVSNKWYEFDDNNDYKNYLGLT